MGESLGRIKTWVQEHPLIAALILGAVILVGYLVYRSRAGGGGTQAASDQGQAPADQGAGAGAGGEGIIPSPVPLPIPQPVETGGGGGGHIGHVGNINPGGGGGISFPPDVTGIGDYGLPTQIPVQPLNLDAYSSGPGGKSKAHYPLPVPSPISTYSSGPGGKVKAGQTPAQQAGKGKNFTGFFNGVYYLNGYPSSQYALPSGVIQQGETFISTTGNRAPVVGKQKY